MFIKNHVLLPLCLLILSISNSTVLAISCTTTQTKTTCRIDCDVGTASLVCGNNKCTGGCKDLSKMMRKITLPGAAPNAEISHEKKDNRNVIETRPVERSAVDKSSSMPDPKWSKMFNLSGLVTDIYINNDGNIGVDQIINFLKENKDFISEEDKKYYGDIIFPDLKKEISAISDDDWKVIEKSFSGLTKKQIMNRKNEDLLIEDIRTRIKPISPK
ncbi:hypothetical protein THII_2148 [Thioploca ingrica]|uniref:Lipoprotein n=1 Tax=Thioploca ingrica TaxID=40754 RepID=A0A090AMH0_9GAMM|nr:hypothetical protein THII_2148 [Thioploca ingrica]